MDINSKKYNVFISYRRNTGDLLARLVKENLIKKYGEKLTVFYDQEEITNGYFESVIKTAIISVECVIVLLSKDSLIERENDYFLKEIEFSLQKNKPIVLLTTKDFESPVSYPERIKNLQHLHQIVYNDTHYISVFSILFNALENINNNVFGEKPILDEYLKSLLTDIRDFNKYEDHCNNYIGRTYLEQKVRIWAGSEKEILHLTGNSSSGKSFFAAYIGKLFSNNYSTININHFFSFKNPESCDIVKLAETCALVLSMHCDFYYEFLQKELKDSKPNYLSVEDAAGLFEKYNWNLFKKKVLLVLDGIDELSGTAINDLRYLITALNKTFNFRFVLLSQNIEEVCDQLKFRSSICERLDNIENYITDDLTNYARKMFYEIGIDEDDIPDFDNFLEELSRKCNGDFILLKSFINDIEIDGYDNFFLDACPRGLNDYYQRKFEELFPTSNDYIITGQILGLLCAAKSELSIDEIKSILSIDDEYVISNTVSKLSRYLVYSDGKISISHNSFFLYLSNIKFGNKYYISIKDSTQKLLRWIIDNLTQGGLCYEYIAKYGFRLLLENNRIRELAMLMITADKKVERSLCHFIIIQKEVDIIRIFTELSNQKEELFFLRPFFKTFKMLIESHRYPVANKIVELFDSDFGKTANAVVNFITKRVQNYPLGETAPIGESLLSDYNFDTHTQADIMRLLGDKYRQCGMHSKATDYYYQSRSKCNEDSEAASYIDCSISLSDMLFVRGDINGAFDILGKQFNKKISNVQYFKLLKLRGQMYYHLGRTFLANTIYSEARKIADKCSPVLRIDSEILFYESYIQGTHEEVIEQLLNISEVIDKTGLNRMFAGKAFCVLSKCYYCLNNYSKAQEYAQKAYSEFAGIDYASGKAHAQVLICKSIKSKEILPQLISAIDYYKEEKIYPCLYIEAMCLLYEICNKKLDGYEDYYDYLNNIDISCFPQFESQLNEMKGQERFNNVIDVLRKGGNQELSGYYNNNYIINANNRKYFIRTRIENYSSIFDMRLFSESALLELLQRFKFPAPYLFYKTQEHSKEYMIFEFIENDSEQYLKENQAVPSWVVTQISDIMYLCHSKTDIHFEKIMPTKWVSNIEDFNSKYIRFIENCFREAHSRHRNIWENLSIPVNFEEFMPQRLINSFLSEDLVFCHADVHRKNVIINSQIETVILADWELALIAPASYDIASHLYKFKYSLDDENLFKESYRFAGGKIIEENIEKYYNIEVIKSISVDLIRYREQILLSSEIKIFNELTKRFHNKLKQAYKFWETPSEDRKSLEDIRQLFKKE